MTYIELITNAYRARNVIDTNQAPDAEQGAAAVTMLNQLMAELAADGVELQYVAISAAQTNNALTIPPYAEGGITAALAARIKASAPLSNELQGQYEDGMGVILRRSANSKLQPPSMAHIPAGSGFNPAVDDFYSG